MPFFGAPGCVLNLESENGIAFLDGVFPVGVVGGKGGANGVEGGGGGEVSCRKSSVICGDQEADGVQQISSTDYRWCCEWA